MPAAILSTLSSFLDHNGALVVFGTLTVVFFMMSALKPNRGTFFLFFAFLLLTLKFEYEKHLFLKIQTDMLDLMFPVGTRFTKYAVINLFLEEIVPLGLGLVGWVSVVGSVISAIFFGKPGAND